MELFTPLSIYPQMPAQPASEEAVIPKKEECSTPVTYTR